MSRKMSSPNIYIYERVDVPPNNIMNDIIPSNVELRKVPVFHEKLIQNNPTLHLKKVLEDTPEIQEFLPIFNGISKVTLKDETLMVFAKHEIVSKVLRNDFIDVIKDSIILLQHLHSNNIIHHSIHPLYLCKQGRYGFIWNHMMVPRHVLISSKLFSESPIVTPLQIILEILGSKHEENLIELKYFKTRIIEFWTHLLKKQCQDMEIQPIAISYFLTGSFYDYYIKRYCIFDESGLCIVKDSKKALGYLEDIDMFSLGITLHYLASTSKIHITNKIKNIIFKLIQGDMQSILIK